MMHVRTMTICAAGLVFFAHGLNAQDLARYRNFELGSRVTSVSTLTGVGSPEVKTIHQRPAVLQDLEWRPSRWMDGSASTDPVEQILFSFCDDQLFRIVVDYSRDRTQGMTGADMIEAVSAVYGAPRPRAPRAAGRLPSRIEVESGAPLARWGATDRSVVLYQQSQSYGDSFRLIVTEIKLDDLARKAEVQALRLDDQEAPQREIARQKKARDDTRAAAAKARVTNKGVFRP